MKFFFFLSTYLYERFIIASPTAKETSAASKYSLGSEPAPREKILAPKTTGMESKNENLTAVFSFSPRRRPEPTLEPVLEIPLKMENACAIPMIIAAL